MKANAHSQASSWILLGTITIIILYGVFGMDRFSRSADSRHTDAIKQAILTTATHCYALEGSYPPDIAYLEENYGLMLDRQKYSYVYDIFASNIRPEVEVLPWNTDFIQP